MRQIGFSTGALALGDWQKALDVLNKSSAKVVELSALREQELVPLLNQLPMLDLSKYDSVIFHAPSKLEKITECELVKMLNPVIMRRWPIVVHPVIIQKPELWSDFGELLCIENMDGRQPDGRTPEELKVVFEKLQFASFCFDIGHARHVDRTMSLAEAIVQEFHTKMKVIHLSEVDVHGHHVPLSLMAMLSFSRMNHMLPDACPIILESPVRGDANDEIKRVAHFLSLPSSALRVAG
jgi:hypothetical protein